MNKKLIAVAVSAAFAAPMAASADATIYGSIHTSLQAAEVEAGNGTTLVDNWDVIGNDGQLGIKGSEDIGGGMKALYKIEMNFDGSGGALDTQAAANPAMTWDEVWIGVTGGWGTALIGREDTPYKTFMDSTKVDLLGDSIIDVDTQLTSVGAGGFERFTANGAIAYVSPTFSGFTFAGAIVPGGQNEINTLTPPATNGPGPDGVQDGIADHYSLGANYKLGGLTVAAAYENKVPLSSVTATNAQDQENLGIGASYKFGAFFVGAKYEEEENVGFANNVDAERFAVSGSWSFGNNTVGLTYGQDETEATGLGTTNDSSGWGVFAQHSLSNRTSVYVTYGDAEDDAATATSTTAAEASGFALGMIHNF